MGAFKTISKEWQIDWTENYDGAHLKTSKLESCQSRQWSSTRVNGNNLLYGLLAALYTIVYVFWDLVTFDRKSIYPGSAVLLFFLI